jgi:hypothetical protein
MHKPESSIPSAVLIVNYDLGTRNGVGGRRWALFGRALLEAGNKVHFLTTRKELPEELQSWQSQIHQLNSQYPGIINTVPTSLQGKLAYKLSLLRMRLSTKGTVFDLGNRDKQVLLQQCRSLIKKHHIRVCIFTGAPFSYLYYGTLLKKEFPNLILVSDFRDKWTEGFNYGMRTLSNSRRTYEQDCERAVVEQSDLVTVASEDIADYLKNIHHRDYLLLYNVVSPILHEPTEQKNPSNKPADRFHIAHVGNISDGCEVQTEHFLNTLKVLSVTHPGRFTLSLVGCPNEQMVQQFRQADIPGVNIVGRLPQQELGSFMSDADAFLVFNREVLAKSIPTKFFDYIIFRKPLIAYKLKGKLSELITNKQLGLLLDHNKPAEVAAQSLTELAGGAYPFNQDYSNEEFTSEFQMEVLKKALMPLLNRQPV